MTCSRTSSFKGLRVSSSARRFPVRGNELIPEGGCSIDGRVARCRGHLNCILGAAGLLLMRRGPEMPWNKHMAGQLICWVFIAKGIREHRPSPRLGS